MTRTFPKFTIGQLTSVQTETPDDSPSGNSPPDRNPWAVHHWTETPDNSPLGSSTLDRQKPSGQQTDASPRQFTIGMFITGQTETPDNSSSAEQGCVTVQYSLRWVTHTDTYSQDGRLLKVDADSDLVMVTGGELSQVIILSVVNCLAVNFLCSAAHLLHPSQLH